MASRPRNFSTAPRHARFFPQRRRVNAEFAQNIHKITHICHSMMNGRMSVLFVDPVWTATTTSWEYSALETSALSVTNDSPTSRLYHQPLLLWRGMGSHVGVSDL